MDCPKLLNHIHKHHKRSTARTTPAPSAGWTGGELEPKGIQLVTFDTDIVLAEPEQAWHHLDFWPLNVPPRYHVEAELADGRAGDPRNGRPRRG